MKRKPRADEIDQHIGQQLRLARNLRKMSQQALAAQLDISFQQLQKYECGTNRIAASRLYQLARCLGVTLSFFFDGLENKKMKTWFAEDIIQRQETAQIIRAHRDIENPQVRAAIHALVRAIARESD